MPLMKWLYVGGVPLAAFFIAAVAFSLALGVLGGAGYAANRTLS